MPNTFMTFSSVSILDLARHLDQPLPAFRRRQNPHQRHRLDRIDHDADLADRRIHAANNAV